VDDGTAHWAHVGGFAFGAAVAFAMKRSGLDHRLDASIDAETSHWQDTRVLTAGKLAAENRLAEAFALLDEAERDLPESIDVQLEMLRLSQLVHDAGRERSAYQRLIENTLRQGMPDAALDWLREVEDRRIELDRGARFRIAEGLARGGRRDRARVVYQALLAQEPLDELGVRAAIAFALLSQHGGQLGEARTELERAQTSPQRTPELLQRIEAQLAALATREAGRG
jgi:tetratricopeptide (TPR) repeat protein